MDYNNTQLAEQNPQPAATSVEYKRLLFHAVRFWYFVVLSIAIGLIVAYLINRYTTRIYPVTASIIIRESEERADAKLLYNNPLANPYRNHYNEPFILRSYPLIQGVVEDLNFQVVIQKEGNFKTTEQYNKLPISVRTIDTGGKEFFGGSFAFQVLDNETFRCVGPVDGHGSAKNDDDIFHFGDTINCHGNTLVITRTGDISSIKRETYQVSILDPLKVAGSYISRMKVNWALQGASVINLDINGPIPHKELDFLQQLIINYQKYDLEKKNQAASRSIDFIDGQLRLIGDSLRFFERQLEKFKQKNIVTDMSGETLRLYQELEVLEAKKVDLMVSEKYYAYVEHYLNDGKSVDQIILPSSMGISDPIINQLISEYIDRQMELKVLKPSEKTNPLVEQSVKIVDKSKANILESVANLRKTDAIKRSFLEQQIGRLESQLGGLPETERMLVNIRRNYALSESIYIFLMQKRAEAGISEASTTSDIVTVNPPRVSGGPITPRIMQNYLVFGGIGLLFPFIVFYLIELFNNKVQSKEDIEKITAVPFIGGLGHKNISSNLVVLEKPKSVLAESFRALRSNLNYFTQGKDHKVFLITSSLSGEGKTFTTINLAAVFALSGKRVLIIGADMRRPKIFDDFGLSNSVGLSTYLSGMTTIQEAVQPTSVENLSLLSGGPVPPNPSELILNSKMDELITELKKSYDFILIDTPPIALVTDGFTLAKYADHSIFLVRQNYTPKIMLKTIDEFYRTGKLSKISIVFNDVKYTGPGYGYGYGYNYGYGYGYYQNAKSSAYYAE